MVRRLSIEVDADTVTCGGCHGVTDNGICKVFNTKLASDLAPETGLFLGWMRCRKCSEAEVVGDERKII